MASRTLDAIGRPYAQLSELREGQRIELDNGFDCVAHEPGVPTTRTVLRDESTGKLFFACKSGKHFLEGQLDDEHGTDSLIGVYPAINGHAHA